MMSVARCAVSVTVVLLAVVGAASAQEGAPFRGETTVNVVEVPVQVVDRATGEPIVGLSAEDFEVLENGKTQTITNFAELWRSERDAAALDGLDPAA
ncbi:MAG TPA: hypothetical protein VLT32_15350, partial [Candidatus Sulfomarinibacteraceae bacterium]|nr:hypothetical protein [Candidatus Sulfomarinibacteraceae bacterium]